MDWIPTLADREGSIYLRIVAAQAADIGSGGLLRGQQLPTAGEGASDRSHHGDTGAHRRF
jgi:hypothetical protein